MFSQLIHVHTAGSHPIPLLTQSQYLVEHLLNGRGAVWLVSLYNVDTRNKHTSFGSSHYFWQPVVHLDLPMPIISELRKDFFSRRKDSYHTKNVSEAKSQRCFTHLFFKQLQPTPDFFFAVPSKFGLVFKMLFLTLARSTEPSKFSHPTQLQYSPQTISARKQSQYSLRHAVLEHLHLIFSRADSWRTSVKVAALLPGAEEPWWNATEPWGFLQLEHWHRPMAHPTPALKQTQYFLRHLNEVDMGDGWTNQYTLEIQ